MIFKLLLIFITLPLLDLLVLLKVAEIIGLLETVGVVVVTGAVGSYFAKIEGINTWNRLRARLHEGRSPSRDLIDGTLILIGAAFLISPGLITDSIGFLLILPYTRPKVRKHLANYLSEKITSRTVVYQETL
ncbi:MAG: Protein affecting phage T7 exclusion by the F plasmid FxsA [Candidatus Methanohalarchaeum thermophilum]|uniref:Protein affecting phage T7 exclusion by the F plasmid FxsA n=1 Tax=Methanohalarchaeum thermophilum TaxID=1903181 RepID=A0A1Q6DS72_METT1|nr:MAG: Protein affecting phage T7 exclusion by the F plasmid FxsA [Candidatus Methanohalarchaeum thermophilum]